MAAGSGAFPLKAGFNQSGGAYLYIGETTIAGKLLNITPGSGSGGATVGPTFAPVVWGSETTPGVSTLFGQGRLVRDMGKTVVSAGRTFKKIQAVLPTDNASSPTGGVTGPAGTSTQVGYATYYVETGYAGANADGSQPFLVRML